MNSISLGMLPFTISLIAIFPVKGDILHVPGDLPLIQIAINAAQPGDTVLIADGVYSGGFNVNLDFQGKPITVKSENGPEATVIDCQGQVRGFNFLNAETNRSVLSGITIRKGNGDGVPSGGGGVICISSSPTIENCRFEECCAAFGGALHVTGGSPVVKGCTFTRNLARESGGGVFCSEGSGATFDSCSFLENYGAFSCVGDDTRPRFRTCRFSGNTGSPAQIVCEVSAAPTFDGCVITSGDFMVQCSNRASPTFTNCLITGNRLGIAQSFSGSSPKLVHCTVAGNDVSSGDLFSFQFGPDPEAQVVIEGSIIWGNAGDLAAKPEDRARVHAKYSLIQGATTWPGPGNVAGDPRFLAPGSFDFNRFISADLGCGSTTSTPDFVVDPGDYRLMPGSPAVDAGSPNDPLFLDAAGNGRTCGGHSDLGAFELDGCPPPTITVNPGEVNVYSWGRELVTVEIRDGEGKAISGVPVDFLPLDPIAARFPYPRAVTGTDGRAFTVLEATLPADPQDLETAFTVAALGLEAGPVPVKGSSAIIDGSRDFRAPPLAAFTGPTQSLAGAACGFVFPIDVGNPASSWSIDPTVAEIGSGAVTGFVENPPCDQMQFEVTAHRAGKVAFIIGTADFSIYQAQIDFLIPFRRSDSNRDGALDISDPINALGFLFTGTGAVDCQDAADSNDDGLLDVSDAIHVLNFLYSGGTAPPAPGHLSCGPDETPDDLPCDLGYVCR